VTDAPESMLTDDEIAALSYGHGRRWRAVLPTVDPDDVTDMGGAVFRGGRSLLARGLVVEQDDGDSLVEDDLVQLVTTALEGDVWVSAYTADRELTFDPTGFTYLNYHRPGQDGVLVEVVTPNGLHRFGELSPKEAAAALLEMVQNIHDGELPVDPAGGEVNDTFCLALPGPTADERRIFAVRRGTVEAATVRLAELEAVDRRTVPLRPAAMADVVTAVASAYDR
jgi:hypothetical protein